MVKFVYKDKSVRLLRPTSHFFDKSDKRDEVMTTRLKDLSFDTGITFTANMYESEKLIGNILIERNKPAEEEPLHQKRGLIAKRRHRRTVREHKRNLMNPSFTFITRNGKTFKIEDLKKERRERKSKYKQAA